MNDQEDIDFINDKLYSLDVPNEPIKNIMFYFKVLREVIDFPFPDNYLNYEHPFFATYDEMEEFLALAHSLNPEFLYHNNVIIYYNEKSFYKYYQLNDDENGKQYEFKIVDLKESSNPIFKSNYKNAFNISNIDKNEVEFNIEVPNKIILPNPDDNSENTAEEHYCEEEEDQNNFQPDENFYSIDDYNDYEHDNNEPLNYQDIQRFYDQNEVEKRTHNAVRTIAFDNQMHSENELEDTDDFIEDELNNVKYRSEKVNIIHKLVVTNDWIDYIYNEHQKELFRNIKTVIKSDTIRKKSISLPKNVFFYLEIIFLALLACCSSTLLSWASTLKNDYRFKLYGGINITNNTQNHHRPKYFIDTNYFNLNQIKQDFNQFLQIYKKSKLRIPQNQIDYFNDTVIIVETNKYHKIHKGCQLGETSGVFALFFFIFIIYMCIRIAREKKAKYKNKKEKVGLTMCHIICFVLLTLLAFVLTLVAEIYISISIAQKTYKFIHNMVRTQLILNSLIFVSYILIILFYFKI